MIPKIGQIWKVRDHANHYLADPKNDTPLITGSKVIVKHIDDIITINHYGLDLYIIQRDFLNDFELIQD